MSSSITCAKKRLVLSSCFMVYSSSSSFLLSFFLSLFFLVVSNLPSTVFSSSFIKCFVSICGQVFRKPLLIAYFNVDIGGENNAACRKRVLSLLGRALTLSSLFSFLFSFLFFISVLVHHSLVEGKRSASITSSSL